jgi:hypothetical protein
VHRAIESDQSENESVPEDPASKRQVDLIARRDVLASRYRWARKVVPSVAPQTTVPPEPAALTDIVRVFRPDLAGVCADVNVSVDRAAEQLPTSLVLVGRNEIILPESGPRFQLLGATLPPDQQRSIAACRWPRTVLVRPGP